MAGGETERQSMWREGIDSFTRNFKPWLRSALIFFVIFLIVQAAFMVAMEPLQDQIEALKEQKNQQAVKDLLFAHWPLFASYFVALVAVVYAQQYVFISFFLTRELPSVTMAPPGVHGFFYFMTTAVQVILVMLLPGLAAGFLSMVVIILCATLKLPAAHFIQFVAVAAAACAFIYYASRWYLAMALAAGGLRTPIKSSWILTEGKVGRLIGNSIILILLILAVVLVFVIGFVALDLLLHMTGVLDDDNAAQMKKVNDGFRIALSVIWNTGLNGIMAAYMCAICRILYQEKRQSDPSFVLESRA
jgi:hypothetical protein